MVYSCGTTRPLYTTISICVMRLPRKRRTVVSLHPTRLAISRLDTAGDAMNVCSMSAFCLFVRAIRTLLCDFVGVLSSLSRTVLTIHTYISCTGSEGMQGYIDYI